MVSIGSPLPNASNHFVFWDEVVSTLSDDGTDEDTSALRENAAISALGVSMYVELFETMITDVLKFESHLFNKYEIRCTTNFSLLSPEARYLLARLCLRKTGKWHRLDSLKYQAELGNKIPDAIRELTDCDAFPNTQPQVKEEIKEEVKLEMDAKVEEREVIDLTCCQDPTSVAGPSRLPEPAEEKPAVPDYSFFLQDDTHATLRELLENLSVDELKKFAKQMKVKTQSKREAILNTLLSVSSTQTILSFVAGGSSSRKGKARADEKPLVQTTLPFVNSKAKTQADRLREMVMKVLVRCVRVNTDVVDLFRRINMVYFRSTQYTYSLLTPSILSRSKKRAYATYEHTRTKTIWPSRDAFLAYDEALAIEARMDALLDGSVAVVDRQRTTPNNTSGPAHGTHGAVKQEAERVKPEGGQHLPDGECTVVSDSPRMQNARMAQTILESVYPRWRELVELKGDGTRRSQSLDRFECGHILTRVICKGAQALHILHEYDQELKVLEALISQQRWRKARRGRWYEARALVLMKDTKDKVVARRAFDGVRQALLDNHTHIVYRLKLESRLTKLEKQLNIPREECHVYEGHLQEPTICHIEGDRVYHRASSLILDPSGRPINKPPEMPVQGVSTGQASALTQTTIGWAGKIAPQDKELTKTKSTGKSIWVGRDQQEVTVEMFALEHYEWRGFKGFHTEGRIVTTLFGLLFWDVIFAAVPGAFETPYQAAPLDIGEDTFYLARQVLVDARLKEVHDGDAPARIASTWDEHAGRGTWCVGVRWDLFEKQQLVEIAQCLGGKTLEIIFRVLCEDYVARTSGLPDLLVWNTANREACFVEVKGPGDNLQTNQKIWIDVLLRAGANVQVCRVRERGSVLEPTTRGKGKKVSGAKNAKGVTKRKRKHMEERVADSDDEENVDYSQLDTQQKATDQEVEDVLAPVGTVPTRPPETQRRNRAEVVITSHPPTPEVRVAKKRRLQS